MKKIVVGVVIVLALIIGYSILFSDSNFEKDLKESLPYELKAYNLFDSDYAEYNLEVKDFAIDRHVRNGNYDTADCTIVLEDENIRKTMYVTLYSTKYNTGWQVERYTENQEAIVIPKYAPDEAKIELGISDKGYVNYKASSENSDYSSGFYTKTYSVDDVFEYITYSGEVTVEAEFIEESDGEISSYGWDYTLINDVSAEWTVKGSWAMFWKDTNMSSQYNEMSVYFDFYENITENDELLEYVGNAEGYLGFHEDEKKLETIFKNNNDIKIWEVKDYYPDTAKLTLRCGSVELIFTRDTIEANAYFPSSFCDEKVWLVQFMGNIQGGDLL